MLETVMEFLQSRAGFITAISSIASIVLGVFSTWFAYRRSLTNKNRELERLEQHNRELQQKVETLTALSARHEERHRQSEAEASRHRESAQAIHANAQTQLEAKHRTFESLSLELEELKDKLLQKEQKDQTHTNRIKRMMKLEGRLWEQRIMSGTPRFRPLQERRMPILSVLNLKGGVGKTTLAAHLAAAFAARGYRVLLLDLDLQGSLSSLFIPDDLLVKRFKDKLLMQHFLSDASQKRKLNLLDYATPILGDEGCGLVAASDSMAYAELNLTMQWLLRLGKKDTRFLLRRGLHQKRVSRKYDLVLIDCPPIINTCCVNALAACDQVLIPVNPSRKSAERVPKLLRHLQRLGGRINPSLQVAGLVFNRTHGSQLTMREQDLWTSLLTQSQDQLGQPVHGFETNIRQMKEVSDHEAAFRSPEPGTELFETFKHFAIELEERLPRECRRTSVPVE
jgi:cellulose biosynthesis protein BcsQ